MMRKGSTKSNDPPPPSPPTRSLSFPLIKSTPSTSVSPRKAKEMKERYVFHESARASLLSTEAPAQNYRGLVNLVMLVLFVTHIRLIMENMLKYGILINLTSTYVNWWATIPTLISYNLFVLIAFSVERLVQAKKITEKQCTTYHIINCIAVLVLPISLIEATDALPATGLVVLTNAIVLWMKLISYAYSNKEYRESLEKGQPFYEQIKESNAKPLVYPDNLTLGIRNTLGPLQKSDIFRIIERVMKVSVPNVYIWLIGFYALFHLWLNICAEVLRFGDRNFYGPWWNCTTMDEYWRIWNHIHVPLVRAGWSRLQSGLCVFLVSAIFHELLVSVPVHTFRFWAFMGFMGNIPLIVITRKLFQGSQIGNVIFWLSFCFLGQPLAIVLYYGDYATRYASPT